MVAVGVAVVVVVGQGAVLKHCPNSPVVFVSLTLQLWSMVKQGIEMFSVRNNSVVFVSVSLVAVHGIISIQPRSRDPFKKRRSKEVVLSSSVMLLSRLQKRNVVPLPDERRVNDMPVSVGIKVTPLIAHDSFVVVAMVVSMIMGVVAVVVVVVVVIVVMVVVEVVGLVVVVVVVRVVEVVAVVVTVAEVKAVIVVVVVCV